MRYFDENLNPITKQEWQIRLAAGKRFRCKNGLHYYDKDKNELTKASADTLTAAGGFVRVEREQRYVQFSPAEETARTAEETHYRDVEYPAMMAAEVRKIRDRELLKTDWVEFNPAKKTEFAAYRQALRDLPQTNPDLVALKYSYDMKTHGDPLVRVDDGKWPSPPE